MPDHPENPPPGDPPDPSAPSPEPPAPVFETIEGGAGADEVDPELERLPVPRPRRSPVAALAVLAVGAVLLAHLGPDLRYATSDGPPRELGPARALRFGGGAALVDNTFVAVTGLADYRNALLFEPRGDTYRRAFYRLLGTSGQMWVRAEQTSTRHELSERVVGRLRRFDTLPYADQVRGYYGKLKVTRLLDPAPFQRGAGGEGGDRPFTSLADRSGERIPVSDPARADVTVVVDFPDELIVTLSKERFAVEQDARREVERLGAPAAPAREEKAGFAYVLRVAPAKRNALMTACEQKDFAVKVRRERYRLPLAALAEGRGAAGLPLHPAADAPPLFTEQGGQLVPLPSGPSAPPVPMVVPWERIDSLQIDAPVAIPHDAWVLVEGDVPSGYGWAKALAVVLVLFMAANVWWLTRALRRR